MKIALLWLFSSLSFTRVIYTPAFVKVIDAIYGLSFYFLVIAHVPRKFLCERSRERSLGITLNTRDRKFDFNVIQEIRRFV